MAKVTSSSLHKLPKMSKDRKRGRRQRYIEAIEPFRKRFGCTAAEVYTVISKIISNNERMEDTITHMELEIATLKDGAISKDLEIELLKKQVEDAHSTMENMHAALLTAQETISSIEDEQLEIVDQENFNESA